MRESTRPPDRSTGPVPARPAGRDGRAGAWGSIRNPARQRAKTAGALVQGVLFGFCRDDAQDLAAAVPAREAVSFYPAGSLSKGRVKQRGLPAARSTAVALPMIGTALRTGAWGCVRNLLFAVTPGPPPRTGARGSVSSWCAATCGDQARKTTSFFAAGRVSRRARITSPPAGRSMTDNQAQALQVEPDAGGDIGRCIASRRTQTAPAWSGPGKSLRCSPGGSPPRASRGPRQLTPRLRSSGRLPPARPPAAPSLRPASTTRARGAPGLALGLRSAPQADRSADATAAPGRRRTRRARREERLSRHVHKAASCHVGCIRRPGVLSGGLRRPRTPRPPAAGGSRARQRRPAMPATGTPAAPLTLAR